MATGGLKPKDERTVAVEKILIDVGVAFHNGTERKATMQMTHSPTLAAPLTRSHIHVT